MTRVLISDKLSDEGLAILAAAQGIESDHRPGLAPVAAPTDSTRKPEQKP